MASEHLTQSIVERIQAALRLADHPGTSREEAEAALLGAQRMAAKYHVDLDEFRLQSEEGKQSTQETKVVHVDVVITKTWMEWKAQLVQVIASNFRCHAYSQSGYFSDGTKRIRLRVIGTETDAELVKALVDFAITVGERVCREYTLHHYYKVAKHSASEGTKLRRSWLFGYVDGIRAKYRAQIADKSTGTAIMVVTPYAVMEEVRRMRWSRSRSEHQGADRNNHAYRHGYETGRNPHTHISG